MTITSYRGRDGGHVDETLLAGEADPGYAATQEGFLAEADNLTGLPTGAIDLLRMSSRASIDSELMVCGSLCQNRQSDRRTPRSISWTRPGLGRRLPHSRPEATPATTLRLHRWRFLQRVDPGF